MLAISSSPAQAGGYLFQAWRDQEAWTAEKYRRFDRRANAAGLETARNESSCSGLNLGSIAVLRRVVVSALVAAMGGENDGHFAGRAARFRWSPLHGTRGYLAGIA